jgi:hypothetical protein
MLLLPQLLLLLLLLLTHEVSHATTTTAAAAAAACCCCCCSPMGSHMRLMEASLPPWLLNQSSKLMSSRLRMSCSQQPTEKSFNIQMKGVFIISSFSRSKPTVTSTTLHPATYSGFSLLACFQSLPETFHQTIHETTAV